MVGSLCSQVFLEVVAANDSYCWHFWQGLGEDKVFAYDYSPGL